MVGLAGGPSAYFAIFPTYLRDFSRLFSRGNFYTFLALLHQNFRHFAKILGILGVKTMFRNDIMRNLG